MGRSNLSTKFHIGVVGRYEKSFKEKYKKENDEPLKGSVIQYVTTGVIQRKGLPDIEDVLTLIRLGNNDCSEQQSEEILGRWLENEDNIERGIVGAFCELCKDFSRDICINKNFSEQMNNLENAINEMQNIQNKFTDLINKLKETMNSINVKNEGDIEQNIEDTSQNKNEIVDVESTH